MKYDLKETLVDSFDITDIDLDYYYSDEKDEDGDDIRINILTSNDVKFSECPPAKIDELINGLIDLKHKGTERVYIAEHTDHQGYYFYGVKLEPHTPSKINVWVCIKEFPGGEVDDVFRYDSERDRYYLGDDVNQYTSFKDFEKFPDLFQQKEIEE